MKKSFCLVLFLLISRIIFAQQKPQYTQYIFNNFLLNPAVAGIENYIDIKAGYRNQWQGLDGAPVTEYISANAPIGNNYLYGNANSFPEKGENPMGRSFVQEYQASEPHHGVGIQAVIDKAGPLSRMDVNASYAYHLGLASKLNLALGVAAGFSQLRLDISKINLEESTDPAITSGNESVLKPDLALGLWLYGPVFFVGISGQQLLGQTLSFANNSAYNQGKLSPHIFTTAGYKLFLGNNVAVIPSVMAKFTSPVPVSVDINCKLAFRDKFWVGGGYRDKDSFSAMAGFNIGYLFNISYSYDFTASALQQVSNGSHEIVLGLMLNNRYKVTCPQRQF